MALFERYVVVDWSAAATPRSGSDSIWIEDLGAADAPRPTNHRTRSTASEALAEVVAARGDDRILIGVDACLGYPVGTARLFGLDGVPWRAAWDVVAELIDDDERNRNNRFEVAATLNGRSGGTGGPFWGAPSDRFDPHLRRTKPSSFAVPEFRQVERRLRDRGWSPKSAWQLLGAGSVGGQTLTLLPILHRLLGDVDVWPYTTGLRAPGPTAPVVVAEVWPTWFVQEIASGFVVDAAQVSGTAEALRDADASGELATWFAPRVDDPAPIEDEEGWILGVM